MRSGLHSIRIGIIEDDRLLRDTLGLFLSSEPDIVVSGAYGSAEEALPGLRETAADILLVDLGLPGMPGLDFIRMVRKTAPRTAMLVHTTFADRHTLFSAILAGASGYLLKAEGLDELAGIMRVLRDGGAIMSPGTASMVMSAFLNCPGEDSRLDEKEQAVVKGIAEARPVAEIAAKSGISVQTVHSMIKSVYEKIWRCHSAAAGSLSDKSAVLVVEGDEGIRGALCGLLEEAGFDVTCCDNGFAALDSARAGFYAAVITDYDLPGLNGAATARSLRLQCPASFIIGVSASGKRKEFLDAGADMYLQKPYAFPELVSLVRRKAKR